MKKAKASYTVELALLLPILLFALIAPVYMGYEMYDQTKAVSVPVWDEEICAEEQVLKIKLAKEVLEELR